MQLIKNVFTLLSKIITILLILAIVYAAIFRRDILEHQYDKALGIYYIYKGDKALKKQELHDSISYYRKGLELYPRHYNAWFNLGNIYVLYEDYFAATDAYYNAINLNKKYTLARMNLGIISAEKIGDFDEAIEQYNQVIKTKKHSIYIPFVFNSERSNTLNQAIAYYNMGHAYKQKALYLPSTEKQLAREYLKNAAEAYEKALEIYGTDYDASYNLALTYHLLGNYNNAGKNYCKAIKADYMSFEAHYNLAILLRHLKYYTKSLDEMEKAVLLMTSSKTQYSKSFYVFEILNDVSTTALQMATEEEKKAKAEEKPLALVNGKIAINEEVDQIISEKFKECPVELFDEDY